MAKSVVEVLVDDLDGTEAAESVRLGWNGQWREIELSTKNLAGLSKAIDRYWEAARPVKANGAPARRKSQYRDTTAIRKWAEEHGIAVPSRGRIPAAVEEQYNAAHGR